MARRPRRRVIGLVAAACFVLAAASCSGEGASAHEHDGAGDEAQDHSAGAE